MTITTNPIYIAGYDFNAPFQLKLKGGDIFVAEKVVRIIPKRRIVAFGTWQGKQVVAKLFFDRKQSKRQIVKDKLGVTILKDNKIPTPELYYEGITADQRCHVLLFERIIDAKNLEELWREKSSMKALLVELHAIMIELATQHVLGVLQT